MNTGVGYPRTGSVPMTTMLPVTAGAQVLTVLVAVANPVAAGAPRRLSTGIVCMTLCSSVHLMQLHIDNASSTYELALGHDVRGAGCGRVCGVFHLDVWVAQDDGSI